MRETWAPRILRPDYTWPCPMQALISTTTPPTPRVPGKLERKVAGYVHEVLIKLSEWYCAWFRVPYQSSNRHLPFGLVLKLTDRVSIEEFAAMKMARAAGLPVPRIISFGEHYRPRNNVITYSKTGDFAGKVNRPVYSILMTRLPGIDLEDDQCDLDLEIEEPWLWELKQCISAMRKWRSPYDDSICSVLRTQINSARVPGHAMGPFANQQELNDYLIHFADPERFPSTETYDKAVATASELRRTSYRATFTHGDLKAHNILVGDDGHLTGFLDWESGGWYPEYWDFTTGMLWSEKSYWGQAVAFLGGDAYAKELAAEDTLARLTAGQWSHP